MLSKNLHFLKTLTKGSDFVVEGALCDDEVSKRGGDKDISTFF